jgi:hypothetical protein
MKSTSGIAMALLGAVLGVAATAELGDRRADAQPPAAGPPRYQVSAYAGPSGQGFGHGCYIIDTVTGELWKAQLGQQPQKVGEKIRCQCTTGPAGAVSGRYWSGAVRTRVGRCTPTWRRDTRRAGHSTGRAD